MGNAQLLGRAGERAGDDVQAHVVIDLARPPRTRSVD
jgi:hypothetical protein